MRVDGLRPNEIFVFGSNARGHHRGGAARTAREQFGAVWGQGHGLQGSSYAINSMSGLEVLRDEVRRFYAFANERPDLRFLVTAIGTGIAGYSANEVAPLFAHPPRNVTLPEEFVDVLEPPSVTDQDPQAGVVMSAPNYVDEFGNDVVPGLMLGGPFDGNLFGMPDFGTGAPSGAGHQVQSLSDRGVVAWYALRTPTPIAERYIYEFEGFRDRHGQSVELAGTDDHGRPSVESPLESIAGAGAANTLEALQRQIRDLEALPKQEREQSHERLKQLSANFYSGSHHEDFWNIDDPVRTEARVLRALANAFDETAATYPSGRPWAEHGLNQYLSRARYAQGRWDLAHHSVEMGDYWWAMQLIQLILARRALADQAKQEAVHALTIAVGSLWNAGVDFDYVLEGVAELAFLGDLGPDYPAPNDWAAVALALARGLSGWTPGSWFTEEHRQRLEHMVAKSG